MCFRIHSEVSTSLLTGSHSVDGRVVRTASRYLNSILGFSQVLESNPEEPLTETQENCVNLIKEAGEHLLKLINEILNLARIEAGKVELFTQDLEVNPLIEECLDSGEKIQQGY